MKKLLLVSTVLLAGAFIVNAQNGRASLTPSMANKAFPIVKNASNVDNLHAQFASTFSTAHQSVPSPLTPSIVGYTWYDLQSNSAVGRRIVNYADGTVGMVWTVADNAAATNRGTGYNYWTGTAMKYSPGPTTRIETVRTGFGQLGLLGNGNEVVMAHNGSGYTLSTAVKGSGTWTGVATTAGALSDGTVGYWCRLATGGSDGNSIHFLSARQAGTQLGVSAPFTYSRSTDAGATWAINGVSLPRYDSTRTLAGAAEDYSIDAEGTTVAVLKGGLNEDLTLWKSTNNGTTFLRTLIDSNKFMPLGIDSLGTAADTSFGNDGTMSVVVAPNGTVHVAYACVRTIKGSFFPGDMKLVYWNDNTKTKTTVPILLADLDATSNGGNGNGKYDVGQYTTNYDTTGHKPAARYGNSALLTMPSITAEGSNVYILFSTPTDGDSTADGQSFRDIWIIASQNNGVTWGKAQNISCAVGEEHSYPCLAKRVDTYLHVLYQWDTEPGTNWGGEDQPNSNEIHYVVVKKANVLAGTASCSMSGNAVEEQTTNLFNVSDNYPNPTTGLTNFDVTMKQNANIVLSIYNGLGQEVYTNESKLSIGKHTLTVDASNFASGLYFYTIKSGSSSISGKISKQ